MADTTPRATSNRSTTPGSSTFKDFIGSQWADRGEEQPEPREQAAFAAERRARISELHPGRTIVVPAGQAKVRSNDCDYPFRPHSTFAHLTGWGTDTVVGSVLVMTPNGSGHDATLYFRATAGRDSEEFYANPEIGEFWVGPRPSLDAVAADLGLATADLGAFTAVADALDASALLVREADDDLTRSLDARIGAAIGGADETEGSPATPQGRRRHEARLRRRHR
jgi:Xaa-Pro aminopeptidase